MQDLTLHGSRRLKLKVSRQMHGDGNYISSDAGHRTMDLCRKSPDPLGQGRSNEAYYFSGISLADGPIPSMTMTTAADSKHCICQRPYVRLLYLP